MKGVIEEIHVTAKGSAATERVEEVHTVAGGLERSLKGGHKLLDLLRHVCEVTHIVGENLDATE